MILGFEQNSDSCSFKILLISSVPLTPIGLIKLIDILLELATS
jgi:hypothetical protein